MKLKLKLLLISLLTILPGCTTNNGDIGPLFGQWKLTEILIDGEPEPGYNGDIFWQFQSHVISMRRIDPDHTQHFCFGSWQMPDNKTLQLDFSHTDDENTDWRYKPFEDTMLPTAVSNLDIVTLNSSRITATYLTDSGQTITYRLIKW